MKILLIGHTGTIGSAVYALVKERGHEVVTASREHGDIRVDMTDSASIKAMYESAGEIDAVMVAAGHVPFKPITELSPEDFTAGWHGKALSQITIVLEGVKHVKPGGSFTLISGILSDTPVASGSAASTVNGAIEKFVMAASAELKNDVRINVISPTIVTESLEKNGKLFPGFHSVSADDVAHAYIRSLEGIETGKVLRVA